MKMKSNTLAQELFQLSRDMVFLLDGVEKSAPKEKSSPLVMTIGHSTRTLEEFIALLQTHGASCVVDVRTVPRSRHNPQFNCQSAGKTSQPSAGENQPF